MSTQTLSRPAKYEQQRLVLNVAQPKFDFLMELLGNFNFVEIEKSKCDFREEIITNLKVAAEDLKLLREGKLETRPLADFLNEL